MITDITYKIQFYSEWHCGSGLAAGADVDALVVKDKYKLPFVPGKTIKGLIKEAVEDIIKFQNKEGVNLNESFGYFDNKDGNEEGCMYFSNAVLPDHDKIVNENLQEYMYRNISSTCIDNKGIAKEHSLRRIETVVPCCLVGKISNVPENMADIIITSFGYIKRLGVNRNRGLGRCSFIKTNVENVK